MGNNNTQDNYNELVSKMNFEPEILKDLKIFNNMKIDDKISDIYQNTLYTAGCLKVLKNAINDNETEISKEDIGACLLVITNFFDTLVAKLTNIKSSLNDKN